jgi:(p)ppGpp synthase/HD superfamily hydrolase
MATLETALRIAAEAHEGQTDKQGEPYITHPLRVMARVEDRGPEARIVALLHDVIEDSNLSADDLRAAGFSDTVVDAVLRLTHREGEPYAAYVVRCAGSPIAKAVKMADLEDNARPSRALLRPDRIEPDMQRLRKYFLSYKYLAGMLDEPSYRAAMGDAE